MHFSGGGPAVVKEAAKGCREGEGRTHGVRGSCIRKETPFFGSPQKIGGEEEEKEAVGREGNRSDVYLRLPVEGWGKRHGVRDPRGRLVTPTFPRAQTDEKIPPPVRRLRGEETARF